MWKNKTLTAHRVYLVIWITFKYEKYIYVILKVALVNTDILKGCSSQLFQSHFVLKENKLKA